MKQNSPLLSLHCYCLVGFLLLSISLPRSASAQNLPADLSAKILLRALGYDRRLSERVGSSITVVVLYGENDSPAEHDDIFRAFQTLSQHTMRGLPMHTVEHAFTSAAGLKQRLQEVGGDVLYLCPGLATRVADILAVAQNAQIATIAASDVYFSSGVAMGVTVKDSAPKLWINLASSRTEGIDLAADIMRIAEAAP